MKRGQKEIAWFAEQMQQKLSENEHKDSWNSESLQGLNLGMLSEQWEMLEAIKALLDDLVAPGKGAPLRRARELIRECADVANFAMMIADNAALLAFEKTEEPPQDALGQLGRHPGPSSRITCDNDRHCAGCICLDFPNGFPK